jgi:hypothetical protein
MRDKEFGGRSFASGINHPVVPPGLEKGYSQSSGQTQSQSGSDSRLADAKQDYQQLKIDAQQRR